MDLDHDACYRVISIGGARLDGRLFVGVKTTGIYCRPICPARTPKSGNVVFYPAAAAAQAAEFRPCLRCRPLKNYSCHFMVYSRTPGGEDSYSSQRERLAEFSNVDQSIKRICNAKRDSSLACCHWMAEFGRIAAQGLHKLALLIGIVRNDEDERVPDMAHIVPQGIADGIVARDTQVAIIETRILAWHGSNPMSQRVAANPGIGPIIATAIAADVAEQGEFHGGREFAAWPVVVPRQNSTGGKTRLRGISKRGDS